MGKTMSPIFPAVLDRTLFMLAGNDNIHESLDLFKIHSNLIRDHRVSCSKASKNRCFPLFSFHSNCCGYTWEIDHWSSGLFQMCLNR